ncbi:MAG: UDP-N-acetylmuramoyl-L-alanyl-D-glutamate--2,6-diaminopimelate ligase [Candidatus Omnitrophica bacterium]|nr:UDP-N-acetylmuramoyl-L-alanyl-D-glutamate--2,6-diaminopimelate ligase [Candidatus Omnitrophota bacterium]
MELSKLTRALAVTGRKNWNPTLEISAIVTDSRRTGPGDLFVACPGPETDGHLHYEEAIRRKAAVLVGERPLRVLLPAGVSFIQVASSREALSLLLNQFYDFPSRRLKLIGITGTNGKTTLAYLLKSLLNFRIPSAYLGTLGYESPRAKAALGNTTPGSVELYRLLNEAVKEGVRSVALEVSSHALDQQRIGGLEFELAVFTGLSPEHLDYHKTMADYYGAKRRLFEAPYSPKKILINRDSEYGKKLLGEHPGSKTYSLEGEADYRAREITARFEGSEFVFEWPGGRSKFHSSLALRHNVENMTAVLASLHLLGFNPGEFREALGKFSGVPGRLEPIEAEGFRVFVDYAHTPDAFENVLARARELHPRRILTLFGCGGDRDSAKRPEMTRIAYRYSDIVVLTSDNPRTEDPAEILRQMRCGLPSASNLPNVREIPDRREALGELLAMAEAGDVLFILGKGHEDTQVLATRKIHFDDRETVREILKQRQAPLLH